MAWPEPVHHRGLDTDPRAFCPVWIVPYHTLRGMRPGWRTVAKWRPGAVLTYRRDVA